MRRSRLAVLFSVLTLGLVASACDRDDVRPRPNPKEAPPAASTDLVKRGAFLVGMGGCNDCHTPMKLDPAIGMPVPQMERMLSGHPVGAPDPSGAPGAGDQAVIGPTFTSFRLPFGTVYSANLTPDPETGIGLWTEAEFVRAIRTGRHRGAESGRPIMPPMPWMNVKHATSDDDLKAIYAYLRTVPPVKNAVPEPNVPPPVYQGIAASYARAEKSIPSM